MLNGGQINGGMLSGSSDPLVFAGGPLVVVKQKVASIRATFNAITLRQSVGQGFVGGAIINYRQSVEFRSVMEPASAYLVTFRQAVHYKVDTSDAIILIQRVYDE